MGFDHLIISIFVCETRTVTGFFSLTFQKLGIKSSTFRISSETSIFNYGIKRYSRRGQRRGGYLLSGVVLPSRSHARSQGLQQLSSRVPPDTSICDTLSVG